nr:RecName: Full=Laxative peptide [Eugenia dysenterica]
DPMPAEDIVDLAYES